MSFQDDLAKFRAYGVSQGSFESLTKSISPDDFKGFVRGIDPSARSAVDENFHLEDKIHPGPRSKYEADVLGGVAVSRRAPGRKDGISKKLVYKLNPISGQAPQNVLVKPYHEKIDRRCRFWMHHPVQGWAEMANQSLYHAAKIGHLHQTVHVSKHNMGSGMEQEPALVVHMTPHSEFVENMGPRDYDPAMHNDLAKIAAMDFLTHNMDRHPHNLLFTPRGVTNQDGSPRMSRLLAIDHGRSFQYKSSVKGIPTRDQLGRLIPPEHRPDPKVDNLRRYLGAWGIRAVDRYNFSTPIDSPNGFIEPLKEWWPDVRDDVVKAMQNQLAAVKDPDIRNHIEANFLARANFLDKLMLHNDPDNMMNEDLEIPIIPFKRRKAPPAPLFEQAGVSAMTPQPRIRRF